MEWTEIPAPIIEKQKHNVDEVIKRIKNDKVALAELNREIGRFEDCISILGDISQYMNEDAILAAQILEHAKNGDRSVFQIEFNKR